MITDAEDTFKRWTDFPGLVRKIFVRAPDSLATKSTHLWETLEDADEGHYAARVECAEANSRNRLTLDRYDFSWSRKTRAEKGRKPHTFKTVTLR